MPPDLSTRGRMLFAFSGLIALTYGAVAREWITNDAPVWAVVIIKTACVALLAGVAWSEKAPRLLIGALALGALGDALLAMRDDMLFIAGGIAFFAGHILYILLFLGAGIGIAEALKQQPRLLAMAALVAAAMASAVWLWPWDDAAALPATILYTLALTGMVLSAFTLPKGHGMAMLGAVLFFVSDVVLTWHMNKPPADPTLVRVLSDGSWFAYYFGQALLCLGSLKLGARS